MIGASNPSLGSFSLARGDRDDDESTPSHTSALPDPAPIAEHLSEDPLVNSPHENSLFQY